MTYPSSWRRYITAPSVSGHPSTGFARFGARYHLASAFEGIRLEGISEATTEAYSSALGVSLAYSALESLDKATFMRSSADIIGNEALARKYRSSRLTKLRSLLESTAESSRLREQLSIVGVDPEAHNVMPWLRLFDTPSSTAISPPTAQTAASVGARHMANGKTSALASDGMPQHLLGGVSRHC